jgi:large conductance mechanosensitive channel
MFKEFRAFLLRGNVIDLAVAVVLGAAFGAVVAAFVKDLITPLIAAIFGKPDFSAIYFTVHGSKFLIGDFINVLIAFLLVAAVIFFLVIKPVNALVARSRKDAPADTRACPECLSLIPVEARRCAHCGEVVAAG